MMTIATKKRDVSYEARARGGRTVMAFGHTMRERAEDFAKERGLVLVSVTRTEQVLIDR
jgi:hypothetical protein